MKDTIRLFVAAILPEQLKLELLRQAQRFEHPHLRMMPQQNLHLTLYFIGNVPVEQLNSIRQTVAHVAQQHQPFTLHFEQTEAGPTPKKPRLVWARFAPNNIFSSVSHALASQLAAQEPSSKAPIPHVTLARYHKDKPVPSNLPVVTSDTPLVLQVNGLALWQSRLGSPHPTYEVLQSYPLGHNP